MDSLGTVLWTLSMQSHPRLGMRYKLQPDKCLESGYDWIIITRVHCGLDGVYTRYRFVNSEHRPSLIEFTSTTRRVLLDILCNQ